MLTDRAESGYSPSVLMQLSVTTVLRKRVLIRDMDRSPLIGPRTSLKIRASKYRPVPLYQGVVEGLSIFMQGAASIAVCVLALLRR